MSNKSVEQLYNERAFEIYQRRVKTGAPGDSHSDWAQAKKEVDAELKKKAPEAKPVSAPKAEVRPAPVAPKAEVKPAVTPKAPAVAPKAPAAAPAPIKKVAAAPVKKTVAKR